MKVSSWYFEISIRTEKKIQFEMNAKMDISKNQWRSTRG
jgi:hypothetical protein